MSNRLSMTIIERLILEIICGDIPSYEAAKEYLDAIGQKFKEFDKTEIMELLNSFYNTQNNNPRESKLYFRNWSICYQIEGSGYLYNR